MNIKRFFESFKYACRGIRHVFVNEQNFRVQLYVTVLVLAMVWFFQLRKSEMVVILLLILIVLILELLNGAVEKLSDVLKPRLHFQIEVVKDIMSAIVLVASLGSTLIGIIIFWPYIVQFINNW